MPETKPVTPKLKKAIIAKTRTWSLISANSRDLANVLNKLSAEGYKIFSVNSSANVGGSYEILHFIDK